jgi:arsenate reductase (thioredoxin)
MKTILFMCPHGAAKSVMAATYFNQLAGDLEFRAAMAGTEPDEVIMPIVADLLKSEGFDTSHLHPRMVTPDDLANASRVISLGCDVQQLPVEKTESWHDVLPASQNLIASRNAIYAHVEQLVAELQEQEQG